MSPPVKACSRAYALADALGRVPLLLRTVLIVAEDLIDDPGEGVQLRTPDRLVPPIPGRPAVAQHLAHRLAGEPDATRRRALAQPFHIDTTPHIRIELHSIHPSRVPQKHSWNARWTTRAVWFSAARRRLHTADPVVYFCSAVLPRRRVSANSLSGMVRRVAKMLPGFKTKGSRFFYPQGGYGQISDAYHRDASDRGVTFLFGSGVERIRVEYGRAVSIVARAGGEERELEAHQILSTIPLPVLAKVVRPEAPREVLQSGEGLRYRAMILVYLVLETDRFSEYDAHYFPGREVAITRLSEPKNYGLKGKAGMTVLCAEIPCAVGGHGVVDDRRQPRTPCDGGAAGSRPPGAGTCNERRHAPTQTRVSRLHERLPSSLPEARRLGEPHRRSS